MTVSLQDAPRASMPHMLLAESWNVLWGKPPCPREETSTPKVPNGTCEVATCEISIRVSAPRETVVDANIPWTSLDSVDCVALPKQVSNLIASP